MSVNPQPSLQAARLLLRPFTMADAPDVQQLAGAWEFADTTLVIPHPYLDGMAEDWIATYAMESCGRSGALRDDQPLVREPMR